MLYVKNGNLNKLDELIRLSKLEYNINDFYNIVDNVIYLNSLV